MEVENQDMHLNHASMNCSKYPQYCNNGKKKSKKELENMHPIHHQPKIDYGDGYDTPDIPGQCDRPHCYDERRYLDSDGIISVELKPWEEIDKVDLTVDVLGIVGDVALTFGGPPGAVFWFFTEVPELLTVGKSFDQLDAGDASAGMDIAVDVVSTIADVERLSPWAGSAGNVVSIGLNVFEIKPVMP
jgi:hypothetical protein